MAGVTQQSHVALAPTRQRIAVDQRPFVYGGAGRQHVLNLRMEFRESFAEFPHVAHGRPGFDSEAGLWLAGDEIDLATVGLHIIDDDVPVGAPPLSAIFDRVPV
jgi:hypothetical protein